MKEYIKYYYNISTDDINEKDNIYYFYYNSYNYMLMKTIYDDNYINELNKLVNELKTKNIFYHDIILNNYNKYLSNINNNNYILLKIYNSNNIDLIDIIKNNELINFDNNIYNIYNNNWEYLWSTKIDYFEEQITKIGKDNKIVLSSFNYYIGLGENAIKYVNKTNNIISNNYILKVCHKNNSKIISGIYYYNPLNIVIDLEVRDISEYIKYIFFNTNDDALLELDTYLKMNKLNNYDYNMLYARLLYPSYYFDLYEIIMNNNVDDKILVNIINRVDDYEMFLKKAYLKISEYAKLFKIDWLN